MDYYVPLNGVILKIPLGGSGLVFPLNGALYRETLDSDEDVIGIDSVGGYLVYFGGLSVLSGGQQYNLPFTVGPGSKRMSWNKAPNKVDNTNRFSFNESDELDNHYRKVWGDSIRVDKEVDTPYISTIKIDNKIIDRFKDFENHPGIETRSTFVTMDWADIQKSFLWGLFSTHADSFISVNYRHPKPNDIVQRILWEDAIPIQRNFLVPFNKGIIADIHHQTMWGPYWYSLWCESVYYPPDGCIGVPFRLVDDPQWGVCSELEIYIGPRPNVRCPWIHKHSGVRDQYINVPTPPPAALAAWVFYMMNTISIKRLPDNTFIDCYSVDVQTDMDSWTWDFSIVLPDQSYLNLVKPQLVGSEIVLMDLEVMINGWKWVCKIESWQESRSFGKRSWTVRGRSSSVELAAPYALPGVFTNIEARQGSQLVDEVLQYTGWSAQWGFENNVSTYSDNLNPTTGWLIPANVFAINEKTRIQALQHILDAIGAKIITNPNCVGAGKFFTIVPRYKYTPWNWGTQTVDHMIHENACWEMGRSYENKPKINSVVVSGENAGAIINAVLEGSAGNKAAPMITHPLITSQGSGHEKAKMILSSSGMWTQHTLKLFSLDDFVDPQGTFPGLLLPGKLIQVTEGLTSWRGQITSVHVHGESISGTNGVQVTQTAGVEEYHG